MSLLMEDQEASQEIVDDTYFMAHMTYNKYVRNKLKHSRCETVEGKIKTYSTYALP